MLADPTKKPAPSDGSIAFVHSELDGSDYELFRRGGSVYRAPVSNAVMPDGFRCGRWEGYDRDDTIARLAQIWEIEL